MSQTARTAFGTAFAREPDGVWSAPGRVNVIGEHLDYNDGPCLPIALPQRTWVALALRDDDRLRLTSVQRAGEDVDTRVGDIRPGHVDGWSAYAAGVLWALRENGFDIPGIDAAVASDVPEGAGLSSSAALECAVAVALASLLGLPGADAGDDAGRAALAAACVRAENEVAGAPTGGMDQAAALRCREGHALLLDTLDGSVRQVPFDLADAGLELLVIDTRASHALGDGQYGDRRRACEEAAAELGLPSLRSVGTGDLASALDRLDSDVHRRRVRHVVTETARVAEVVAMLEESRAASIGPVLDASHASLRDDCEVSCAELDVAVAAARDAGALGARMTGGGFGGSAIALVRTGGIADVRRSVQTAFARRGFDEPAFLAATPSAPAS